MYDVVIIGSGIGGLVCGCTLAKAGMKVLIVEQHTRPGGYCASFRRGRYLFDAGPHCFGSYREGGQMRRILDDLSISDRLVIKRPDPCDVIRTPTHRVAFWCELDRTIQEFQQAFPHERKEISAFFSLLSGTRKSDFFKLRHLTLQEFLNTAFSDEKLKSLLALPLVGIGGLPPSRMSACVGAQFYTEFLLDGGYVPVGGMQALSDSLAERFQEFGGALQLSRAVSRIMVADGRAKGIIIDRDETIPSRVVVSNCDARGTFLELLGEETLNPAFGQELKKMVPSLSSFLIYSGMSEGFDSPFSPGTVNYHFSDHDAEKAYISVTNAPTPDGHWYAIRSSLDSSALYIEMLAQYHSKEFWHQNKDAVVKQVLKRVEKDYGAAITSNIVHREAATPQTLLRYTGNYQGASYGWAGIPSQTILPGMRKPVFVQDLYLVGHWTTLAIGISGVAYVGSDTAAMMLRRYKKNGRKRSSVSLS